jgi:hypothetical protein
MRRSLARRAVGWTLLLLSVLLCLTTPAGPSESLTLGKTRITGKP